jgi:predicted metal-binding membrane protein
MTRTTTATLTATLAVAAAAWVVAVHQMAGMDMGTGTELGSFGFFVATWVLMMVAMMLPGAAPAVARRAPFAAVPFAVSYLAIWALVGLAVYPLYQPHDSVVAGALTAAAGLYELTPLKQACRLRCRATARSGIELGLACAGSSLGLMVVLLALGAMSITWMAVVAALVAAQKLLPPRAAVDVPIALAIVALGVAAAL